MNKFTLKLAAALVSVIACSLSFTACGGNEDDPDTPEITEGKGGPVSITAYGTTLFSFSYDSKGRMTSLKAEDMDMTISYSPLKITVVDEDGTSTFTDVKVNSDGYITKAKVTDNYDGEKEVYWDTFEYDKNGHLTTVSADGDKIYLIWENGNMTSIMDDEEVLTTMRYSNTPNTAGVSSPLWNGFGIYWMMGLFGKAPAYFPSAVFGGEPMTFSFQLHSDGRIDTETVSFDDITMQLLYNYGSRAADVDDTTPFNVARCASPKITNIFKRKH